MNDFQIEKAVQEAEKFIERAKALKNVRDSRKYGYPSRESGSCRRQSMELTRALADMRKGGSQ